MSQPQIPQERIIPLLVQEQLPAVAQVHVHLAVLVDIGRVGEGARLPVHHEDDAAADVEEEAYGVLAPLKPALVAYQNRGVRGKD